MTAFWGRTPTQPLTHTAFHRRTTSITLPPTDSPPSSWHEKNIKILREAYKLLPAVAGNGSTVVRERPIAVVFWWFRILIKRQRLKIINQRNTNGYRIEVTESWHGVRTSRKCDGLTESTNIFLLTELADYRLRVTSLFRRSANELASRADGRTPLPGYWGARRADSHTHFWYFLGKT